MSYLDHFKFSRQPFSEHASREALWNDTRMEEGLSRLSYLLGNGLVGLVTGASGLGKSALIRRFIQECSPQVCDPQYCHLAQLPANSLLKFIVTQLGEVPRFGKGRLYSQILERAKRSEGTMMLIFDEAHLLSGDALVDLRLLVSSAVEAGPPLKILLVGQETLRHTLKRAEYTDIVNRVSVRYQLKPFSKDQTRKYIDYSVGSSGGDVKIFDEGVKDLIHEFTGGNPRCINIDFRHLFRRLGWPWKRREDGVVLFVCPECSESQTAVNPKTNLSRCFRCERNWNPIDFTMEVGRMDFLEAYGYLEEMLPRPPDPDDRPF